MRRTAYVLLADPNYLQASLSSYYDFVDRIVLSYDESSTSWTGTPLPVAECLQIVDAMDAQNKCVRAPGHYARLTYDPLDNETHQRQEALDQASEGADWVLQLDTDEVMLNAPTFMGCLQNAEHTGASAMEYPSRWLYSRVGAGRYLERSTRFGRVCADYPGPLAIRAGSKVRLARQTDELLYRVDLRASNTDRQQRHDVIVHEVVDPDHAVLHFSWVRSADFMRRKFGWSGHSEQYSRPQVYNDWEKRSAHPHRTALTTPLRGDGWFRLASIPEPPGGAP